MSLRHAVLAALLSGEYSGYQLAKAFDVGVANFWYARPQQLYLELSKLEKDGLISGREVVQRTRPTKRLISDRAVPDVLARPAGRRKSKGTAYAGPVPRAKGSQVGSVCTSSSR